MTLRMKGVDSTKAPPLPKMFESCINFSNNYFRKQGAKAELETIDLLACSSRSSCSNSSSSRILRSPNEALLFGCRCGGTLAAAHHHSASSSFTINSWYKQIVNAIITMKSNYVYRASLRNDFGYKLVRKNSHIMENDPIITLFRFKMVLLCFPMFPCSRYRYLFTTFTRMEGAAELTKAKEEANIHHFVQSYDVVPLAFEIKGPINVKGLAFLAELMAN